jgi:YebC/PmpR family DNA-binding regulatory protein
MAGHSKWSNIKHRKARQDSKRSKVWSRCARAIIVAARGGGGDPATNLTLRYAVDEAKAANMPKDTIGNAIKKGTGELGGENYEPVTYEGYGTNGVAILVETLTDNKNRTVGEIRNIFDKRGGNLGTSGSVAYLFSKVGQICIAKSDVEEEALMEVALEAGADDISDEGDVWQVTVDPVAYQAVRDAIDAAGITIQLAQITMVASTTVTCTGSDARKLLAMIDLLEDQDDVQAVHANFDIPDDELAALEG